jgi:hypothetical protein
VTAISGGERFATRSPPEIAVTQITNGRFSCGNLLWVAVKRAEHVVAMNSPYANHPPRRGGTMD